MLALNAFASGFQQSLRQWMAGRFSRALDLDSAAMCPAPAPDQEEPPHARLLQSSKGVLILRNGRAHSAYSGQTLQLGDRVMVPKQGQAQFMFHEQGSKALLGRFAGGSVASLVHFSKKDGACSVAFDVLSGKVDLFMETIGESCLWVGHNPSSGRATVGFHYAPSPI
ncbi:hypothetical protein QRD40_11440 [Comamonas sp. Y6]|uniref:Uncharacterized protein n=1 Tax=Comamonas resistens TaxID=3046670 RepID=A0ABY8SS08_9BURK|nr:hypothetical protein [Comamonas resistens]MDL5036956.1 hypothetical protein [Comamonas resistens]WHS65837.1 hypothetical protein QMY55_01355 [Comamonas resistens]